MRPKVRRGPDASSACPPIGVGSLGMDLHPGEHVIYEGHPSWRSTFGFYVLGLIVAVAAGVIAYFADDKSGGIAAAVAAAVFLVVLVVGWLRRVTTRYLITS